MRQIFKSIIPAAAVVLTMGLGACDTLHVDPEDPNLSTEATPEQLLNKCYANMAMAGQGGANGDCDIDGIDGGTSGYVRQVWNANELPTDEAICGWGDEGIASFCYDAFDASHPMLRGLYYRLWFGIALCNQYIDNFGSHSAKMTAEARFLRALDYYELMDLYGNVGFTEHADGVNPVRYTRQQLFEWLESEIKDNIEPNLADAQPKTSSDEGYGSVDKAAAWLLLARMYLNAEVYTGTARWDDARTWAKRVMDSPYQLYRTAKTDPSGQTWSAYQQLFMGDNGENGASVEAIFPILQDGLKTTSWGTSLFLMASANDNEVCMRADGTKGNGTDATWGGNRMRPDLVAKFFPQGDAPNVNAYAMPTAAGDDRALFDGVGRTLDNDEVGTFTNGFAVCKFNNWKTDGSAGKSSTFPETDFFFMRAAEAYLIYAEADARLNGGSTTSEGTSAINALRSRAEATTRTGAYSLNEICDEWSREFFFEGLRRNTLIRFNRFGGNTGYTWQWKGATKEGTDFPAYKNLYAIPTTDLNANPNLTQNPGY